MAINLPEAEQRRRARFVLRDLLFFWPIVDSADDVDRVTRLGYRICMWVLIYNVISIVPDLVNLDWIAYATLVLLVLLYFAGANALRQKSATAAAALCALQATAIPYSFLLNHSFPYVSCLIFLALLIAWRGIALSVKYHASRSDLVPLHISEILPPRLRTSFGRYMTDILPPRIWPKYQVVFWTVLLLLLGCEGFFSYAYWQMHLKT